MKFEEFKEKFDAYLATPQAQIDIDAMMDRIKKEQAEYRNKRNIPIGFTYAQEEALEALRDLPDNQAMEVMATFIKERVSK